MLIFDVAKDSLRCPCDLTGEAMKGLVLAVVNKTQTVEEWMGAKMRLIDKLD